MEFMTKKLTLDQARQELGADERAAVAAKIRASLFAQAPSTIGDTLPTAPSISNGNPAIPSRATTPVYVATAAPTDIGNALSASSPRWQAAPAIQDIANADAGNTNQRDTTADKAAELRAIVAELRAEIVTLRERVIDLEREAETHMFVGTINSKTPFMVEVQYPDGDTKRVQTFGEMRINRLIERIMREKGIDGSSTRESVILKHGLMQLGHLSLVGEHDLLEGHCLVLMYD